MNGLKLENEKLRGLLEAALFYVPNAGLRSDISAALSQQAEAAGFEWPKLDKPAKVGPVRFNVGVSSRTVIEAAQRRYEYEVTPEKEVERIAAGHASIAAFWERAAAEPAPAQDEREAFDAAYERAVDLGWTSVKDLAEQIWGAARATRPAQTEQQPVAVPEGWSIELGFDVLDRSSRLMESKSHTPTIKVIFPPCEPLNSSSWDLRDEVARRIGSMLAAPIAQTAPQGLRIVFDGPPGPEAGRFVEVENASGCSVNAGEWRERADGLWELVLHASQGGL